MRRNRTLSLQWRRELLNPTPTTFYPLHLCTWTDSVGMMGLTWENRDHVKSAHVPHSVKKPQILIITQKITNLALPRGGATLLRRAPDYIPSAVYSLGARGYRASCSEFVNLLVWDLHGGLQGLSIWVWG